jgi:hypothetical protein
LLPLEASWFVRQRLEEDLHHASERIAGEKHELMQLLSGNALLQNPDIKHACLSQEAVADLLKDGNNRWRVLSCVKRMIRRGVLFESFCQLLVAIEVCTPYRVLCAYRLIRTFLRS